MSVTAVTPAPDQGGGEDEPGLLPVAALESAVKATIRQVRSPSLREAMWDAYTKAIAAAGTESPGHMPWEDRATAKVVTVTAARDVCVAVLEAIPELAERNRVKDDIMVPELDRAERSHPVGRAGTRHCGHCGRQYATTAPRSRYCSASCRVSAFKKRKRQAARATAGRRAPLAPLADWGRLQPRRLP